METMTLVFEDKELIVYFQGLIKSMKGVSILHDSSRGIEKTVPGVASSLYRVSPRIKALETGFSLPVDFSDDYKQELNEIRLKRYV